MWALYVIMHDGLYLYQYSPDFIGWTFFESQALRLPRCEAEEVVKEIPDAALRAVNPNIMVPA